MGGAQVPRLRWRWFRLLLACPAAGRREGLDAPNVAWCASIGCAAATFDMRGGGAEDEGAREVGVLLGLARTTSVAVVPFSSFAVSVWGRGVCVGLGDDV